jgi:hypothetical protein
VARAPRARLAVTPTRMPSPRRAAVDAAAAGRRTRLAWWGGVSGPHPTNGPLLSEFSTVQGRLRVALNRFCFATRDAGPGLLTHGAQPVLAREIRIRNPRHHRHRRFTNATSRVRAVCSHGVILENRGARWRDASIRHGNGALRHRCIQRLRKALDAGVHDVETSRVPPAFLLICSCSIEEIRIVPTNEASRGALVSVRG